MKKIRVSTISPIMKVADVDFNVSEIKKVLTELNKKKIKIALFPELSFTGYTCGDLFLQESLYESIYKNLKDLLEYTKEMDILIVVGIPVQINSELFNCGVVINKGQILGLVPKTYLPNYGEFYEKRWFVSGENLKNRIVFSTSLKELFNKEYIEPILFKDLTTNAIIGIEICEDLWSVIPPSSYMALNGANIILNLSASNELIGKSEYRKQLVLGQSSRTMSAYLYSSSGVNESTTDTVFGGDSLISENGKLLARSNRFNRDTSVLTVDLDLDLINQERIKNKTFSDSLNNVEKKYSFVIFETEKSEENFIRNINPMPFIPTDNNKLKQTCEEINNIQVAGLAKRIEHIGNGKVVIGVSGGLDSTLALLVAVKTFDTLGLSRKNIIGVTMPCFGTTSRTYINSKKLMKELDITCLDINIGDSCTQHLIDIKHEIKTDVTFENAQSRERTQVLMDLANKYNGIVLGTGDLSELALGWCTYNGDHMSMYSVNSGIPKTLVKYLVEWEKINTDNKEISETLKSILDTPISPELLIPNNQEITQKTEDLVGPYELHDFFLYYVIRYGFSPNKIFILAQIAFEQKYEKSEILKWLEVFYKRFFTQQFKRSCLPDGPKVGSVNLSPRTDWRMPSDSSRSIWMKEIESLKNKVYE